MRAAYCNMIYCLARERLQYIGNIRFPKPGRDANSMQSRVSNSVNVSSVVEKYVYIFEKYI